MEHYNVDFTKGNSDNIQKAVDGLAQFTHNWCMDCKKTEKGDLTFRCDECNFHTNDGHCLIKLFKNKHLPNYKNFGCMGDL